jgi:CRP/FNR family cyclic AMP-dependent transcriptional regulator
MEDVPREFLPLLAEYALDVAFPPGEVIFRAGDPANRFYLVESGEVEIQSRSADRVAPIERVGAGGVVGWSWLFPPYAWRFDAVATRETKAIFLYGGRLREICEERPELGYALMKATSAVLVERLQATRGELLRRATLTPGTLPARA